MSHTPRPSSSSPSVKSDEAPSGSSTSQSDAGWIDYESIREDLKSRVFVDFAVFMKNVLHVPDDWAFLWKPAIDAVKADSNFKKHLGEYHKLCDELGTHEELPHKSLVNTIKAAFDVLSMFIFEDAPRKGPDSLVHLDAPKPPEDYHRDTTLHILEVNPHSSALCDGTAIPRLMLGGEHATSSFRAWM